MGVQIDIEVDVDGRIELADRDFARCRHIATA